MSTEISKPDLGQGKGLRRMKKLSTKVDLTPMVDLGFLLITFFILTKTLSEPKGMNMVLPAGENKDTKLGESTALTLIPLAKETVLFYNGDPTTALERKLYGKIPVSGVRSLILKKQIALDANKKYTRNDLSLIIKPTKEADLKNIVTVLDEVLINQLHFYSLVDLEKGDEQMLDQLAIAH